MEVESKSIKPPLPMERRPARILKDYLRDDLSSCSSSGFRSLPRRSSCYNTTTVTSIRCLIQKDLMVINNSPPPLLSSRGRRSKAASSSTVNSALQKASQVVMNVVKHFHYFSSAKQGIFARNLSRRLKRSFTSSNKCRSSNNRVDKCDREIGVKVRDIVRWRSFRDMIEENNDELNEQASPIRPNITTTTTTTTTTTAANHSWSDSDFTVSEYMLSSTPSWDYSIESKKEFTEKMIADSSVTSVNRQDSISMDKGEFGIENDQLSPVSVHDFPSDEEDEETPSSTFMSSLDKMESM